jgi:hypothetical protein
MIELKDTRRIARELTRRVHRSEFMVFQYHKDKTEPAMATPLYKVCGAVIWRRPRD